MGRDGVEHFAGSVKPRALCYWAFGLNWSSVQYSDHAGSPRDVIEGACVPGFDIPI